MLLSSIKPLYRLFPNTYTHTKKKKKVIAKFFPRRTRTINKLFLEKLRLLITKKKLLKNY